MLIDLQSKWKHLSLKKNLIEGKTWKIEWDIINDIINQTDKVTNNDILNLKIVKLLLSTSVSDPEVITLLQEQIDLLESIQEKSDDKDKEETKSESNINIVYELPRPSFMKREEPKF